MTGSGPHDTALWLAILTITGAVACCPAAAADQSSTSPVDSRLRISVGADGRPERSGHAPTKSAKGLPSAPRFTDVPTAPVPARPRLAAADNEPSTHSPAISRQRTTSGRRPGTTTEATRPVLSRAIEPPRRPRLVQVGDRAATTVSPAPHEFRWAATLSEPRPVAPQISAPTNAVSISSTGDDAVPLPLVAGSGSDVPAVLRSDIVDAAAVPGSVAMLMVVVIGVAVGYRQARRNDAAGTDVMRFIS